MRGGTGAYLDAVERDCAREIYAIIYDWLQGPARVLETWPPRHDDAKNLGSHLLLCVYSEATAHASLPRLKSHVRLHVYSSHRSTVALSRDAVPLDEGQLPDRLRAEVDGMTNARRTQSWSDDGEENESDDGEESWSGDGEEVPIGYTPVGYAPRFAERCADTRPLGAIACPAGTSAI